MDETDVSRRRAQLISRRDEIETLEAENALAREVVELDHQSVGRLSRMDALQVQAMAQETHRRRLAERQRILLAIKLIDEGEYGWCRSCGKAIPAARLDLDPSTATCVGCAR